MLLTRPRTYHQHQHQHQHSQQYYPHSVDINLDNTAGESSHDLATASISSSPLSTQSLLSQYSLAPQTALSHYDSASTIAVPRKVPSGGLLDFNSNSFDDGSLSLSQPPELMQSDSWVLGNQFTPKSVGRLSHHRESSLSSLGSAGPASPYSHTTSNPHIAVTDSSSDGFHDMHTHDGNSYYQLAKTMPATGDNMYAGYHNFNSLDHSDMGYQTAMAAQRHRPDRGLLPAPDFAMGPTRSHPASVASSIAGDSPATPSLGEPDDDRRRKVAFHNVPKLDRTMTDIYSDELYSPNFTITSASPSQSQVAVSPSNDVFAQRLHAANNQHLSAVHSPVSSTTRDRSPFRNGSPLAPGLSHDFSNSLNASRIPFNSAHRMREQKVEQDAQMMRQKMSMKSEPETPRTISPKDAILEFQEPDGDSNFPLFPQQDSTDFDVDQLNKAVSAHDQDGSYQRAESHNGHDSSNYNYLASHMSTGVQIPQQYPFIAHSRQHLDTPPRLSSAESSSGSSTNTPMSIQKPGSTTADGGTYTCTYHGCTQRFETPMLLQKHKREGHRQAQSLASPRRSDSGMTSALLNSQAGPHRCDRINPSTGKPCSTIFSRPYDLTRHEDTIHNARKQKVRCNMCTEEKTFSRADALTRHYRVCHPDVEFPGKHRRRGHIG